MNYSVDHLVYHALLMQFKINPAIIIGAEVGTEVKSAAEGIITDIYDRIYNWAYSYNGYRRWLFTAIWSTGKCKT